MAGVLNGVLTRLTAQLAQQFVESAKLEAGIFGWVGLWR